MSAGSQEAPRPRRSATQSLLSIVLALDALVVFFLMLTVFGLHMFPPGFVFGAGIALIVVLAVTGRLVAKPWGIWLGHALQVLLIALGFVIPTMFFVGCLFAALWIYCFIAGRRLDRRNDAIIRSHTSESTSTQE
jgi:energy-coupling factor transporter transmembrane protein EcfT